MKKSITIRQKPLEIFIHIISWILIFAFPVLISDKNSNMDITWEQYFRHSFVLLFYCFVFYVNYWGLIPRFWFNGNIFKFIFINFILLASLSIGIHYGQEILFPHPPRIDHPHMHHPPILLFYLRNFLPMIFVVALSMVIRINQQWNQIRDKLIETEREKTEAELMNLKNQLNPHFLLNTLNNIYALIAFDGNKAQESVQELSKLLRYMLYENQSPFVSLKKELEFIKNYVALMRIRITPSVDITINLDEGPKPILISPLIFISLIENAFKHGINPTGNSFICISIQGYPNGNVCCEIKNSNHPKTTTDKSGSGIGLELVRKRLEMLYPGKYEWNKEISIDGSSYTSILTIQTEDL